MNDKGDTYQRSKIRLNEKEDIYSLMASQTASSPDSCRLAAASNSPFYITIFLVSYVYIRPSFPKLEGKKNEKEKPFVYLNDMIVFSGVRDRNNGMWTGVWDAHNNSCTIALSAGHRDELLTSKFINLIQFGRCRI